MQILSIKLHNSLFGGSQVVACGQTDGQSDRQGEGTLSQTFVTNSENKKKKDANNAVSVGRVRD